MSDTTVSPTPAQPSSSRWMKTLLIASLALNLLFAGLAAGAALKWRHHRGPQDAIGSDIALRGFLRTLPKERASELRKAIKEQGKPDTKPLLETLRSARRSAAEALAAEPFDTTKLQGAFAAIDTADAAAKSAMRQTMIEVAGKMTAEERKAFAERWKARRPHLFRGKDDRETPPGPPDEQ